jgi:uncharacterized membrane protein (UPF0127 family)
LIRPTTALGRIVMLALIVAGCAYPPVRSVTLNGERWEVLEGSSDGMRGRSYFGGADAMLFAYDEEVDHRAARWVMDEVAFPLDIAWFAGDGRLVGMTTMAVCPEQPCPLYAAPADYRWAIEAPVGAFGDLPADARLEVPLD